MPGKMNLYAVFYNSSTDFSKTRVATPKKFY